MTLAYWVHNLDPFILKFPEGFYIEGIRWYGVMYLVGFLCGGGLFFLYHKKGKLSWDFDLQTSFLSTLIIGVLIGGRAGYMLLYRWDDFISNPLMFFYINQGGMASHGAMIGVLAATYWFSRHYKTSFWLGCDLIAVTAPLGIFFGRLGNFINGELWGKVSSVSWAVIFPQSAPHWMPLEMIPARHPSQLYAAGLEGLLLFFYMQWRFWKHSPSVGVLTGEFFIGYACVRIFGELFREPDASLILGISRGQFYSLFLLLMGLSIIIFRRKKL